MSETSTFNTETLATEQARTLMINLFERPDELGLAPGTPEFTPINSPDNQPGGKIDVTKNGCALTVERQWDYDETLFQPAWVETILATTDVGKMSRAQIILADGKLLSADYIDYSDPSKTIRHNPTGALPTAITAFELSIETIKETI